MCIYTYTYKHTNMYVQLTLSYTNHHSSNNEQLLEDPLGAKQHDLAGYSDSQAKDLISEALQKTTKPWQHIYVNKHSVEIHKPSIDT